MSDGLIFKILLLKLCLLEVMTTPDEGKCLNTFATCVFEGNIWCYRETENDDINDIDIETGEMDVKLITYLSIFSTM